VSAVDELAPQTRLELVIELRFASHELMRQGTAHIVNGRRPAGHACVVDSITLDVLVARLEEGTMSDELAGLFLAAARELIRRRELELEAAR
jgi:hypothetical protein